MPTRLLLRQLRRMLPALGGCLLVARAAQAQPEPIKYGVVAATDLTAAPFAADSGAAAVVLCDFGRSRLRGQGSGFQVVFERVTRIKILKKAGYNEATIEIPLYHHDNDQEKITNLRGITYNLVGGQLEKTKLEASGAFIEKRTPEVNVQEFTLPNVREGSVIEYAYTLTSDFLFNFQDWAFQRTIPVRWSEYRTSIPSFYRYKIIYQGNLPFAVNKASVGAANLQVDNKIPTGSGLGAGQTNGSLTISAPTEEHQWVLQNVPPFREEPFMTSAHDYMARLDFELTGEQWPEEPYHDLTGTWERINARLLADDDFGGRLGRPGFLHEQLQALAVKYPELSARTVAVRQAVLAAVRYNGTDNYATLAPLHRAFEAHRGTSADVNLLLIAALRDAGIPAEPVLLSTRDHGRISQEYPLLDRFNYVVALVPTLTGGDLLVDATDPLLPCGVLPQRCLSQTGRLITKIPEKSRWVDLVPTQRCVHYQQVNLALDAQGGLTGKVHEEHGGYAGWAAREALAADGEKKYLVTLAQRHEGWTTTKAALGQADNVEKPLTLDYEFSQAPASSGSTGPLYLSPLSDFGPSQNPFTHDSRTFAVDFGTTTDETTMVTLTLPAGYELAEVPKLAVVKLPNDGGQFVYSVAASAGTVQLTSRLSLRRTVYAPDQYASLRELYRLLLEKQGEKLVIQKKAG
ncbi:DUF3857 domain-containing protein [Hymenobacter negativus]|uniref:DUF3857 and transglutaminase domain-containing protein n=1 Tax=Hymenobacter negativus TaxID=2795026 RepID=A0ABS3QEG5_9BACT|nr:DUF3857 domain-containing protein [Hymenobacter negativus]MBO2009616.1 DUF3857 and transglutaminase domain-containing protein [Hymenobacter negativus]